MQNTDGSMAGASLNIATATMDASNVVSLSDGNPYTLWCGNINNISGLVGVTPAQKFTYLTDTSISKFP